MNLQSIWALNENLWYSQESNEDFSFKRHASRRRHVYNTKLKYLYFVNWPPPPTRYVLVYHNLHVHHTSIIARYTTSTTQWGVVLGIKTLSLGRAAQCGSWNVLSCDGKPYRAAHVIAFNLKSLLQDNLLFCIFYGVKSHVTCHLLPNNHYT